MKKILVIEDLDNLREEIIKMLECFDYDAIGAASGAASVKLALDDFGIGYCSLSYLKQLPFDTLKIDQYFVRNIALDETNAAITTAIMQMAQSLKLRVIAEGVETEDELNFLSQQQCDAVQGYLFSRALSSEEFKKLKLVMGHRSWVIDREIGRI